MVDIRVKVNLPLNRHQRRSALMAVFEQLTDLQQRLDQRLIRAPVSRPRNPTRWLETSVGL